MGLCTRQKGVNQISFDDLFLMGFFKNIISEGEQEKQLDNLQSQVENSVPIYPEAMHSTDLFGRRVVLHMSVYVYIHTLRESVCMLGGG